MTKKFDTLVFIGRFQPFHMGHKHIIDNALKYADEVIVIVGSSFMPRTPKNPFTFEERKSMIKNVFPQRNVKVAPVLDYPYNDNKWIAAVQSVVRSNLSHSNDPESMRKIALIGHSKDASSYYLNIFNTWESVDVPAYVNPFLGGVMNATDIRNVFFEMPNTPYVPESLPGETFVQLGSFLTSDDCAKLREEYISIKDYRKAWEVAPYPPTFVTADAVVVQSGKVLLVKRKFAPGKGLYALPGGFVDQGEKVFDAAIRELKEETGLKVPEKVLRRMDKKSHVFDHPDRSLRGRTITHAFFFDLGNEPKMPKIKGSDDAEEAVWMDFADIQTEFMFEDHAHIIDYFVNII